MNDALCAGRSPQWWEPGNENNVRALALCRACPWLGTRCANANPRPREVIVNGTAYDEHGRTIPICDTCGYPYGETANAKDCRRCLRRQPTCQRPHARRVDDNERRYRDRERKNAAYAAARAARHADMLGKTVWYSTTKTKYRRLCVVDEIVAYGLIVRALDGSKWTRCVSPASLAIADPDAAPEMPSPAIDPELAPYLGAVVRYLDSATGTEVCTVTAIEGRALVLTPIGETGRKVRCRRLDAIVQLGRDLRIAA